MGSTRKMSSGHPLDIVGALTLASRRLSVCALTLVIVNESVTRNSGRLDHPRQTKDVTGWGPAADGPKR